jgi:hypothetical protein
MHSRKDVGRCFKRPKNIVFRQRGTQKKISWVQNINVSVDEN